MRRFLVSAVAYAFLWIPVASADLPQGELPEFKGTPYEVGFQHGQHFKTEIRDLLNNVLPEHLPAWYRLTIGRFKIANMQPYFPEGLNEEMKGIADGAGVSLTDVIYGNILTDLAGLGDNPLACSSFAVLPARSANGKMLLGRNLDWQTSLTSFMRKNLRAWIVAPNGKKRILAIGYPGMAGILTGINADGVYMSLNYGLHKDQTSRGRPVTFVLRDILERATTATEGLNLFNHTTPRTIGINVLLADAQAAFAIEATANRQVTRVPTAGIVYMANHFEDPSWQGNPGEERDYRWPVLTRYDATDSTISPADLTDLMGDAAMTDEEWKNVKAVIVDYQEQAIHFGSDGDRAAHGPMHTIDLKRVLSTASSQ